MKVHCQTCGTDFRLDENLVPPEGAWVRCGQCGDTFLVTPEPQPAPPEEPTPLPASEPPEPQAPEGAPQPEPEPEGATAEPEPALEDPAPVPEVEQPAPPEQTPEPNPRLAAGFWAEEATASTLDLSQMERGEAERARKRADFGLEERPELADRPPRGLLFKTIFWLIGILLLAAITALGSVVVMARLGVGHEIVDQAQRLPGLAPLLGRSAKSGTPAAAVGAVRMSLVEVKSFNRVNETSGRIFVIQGKVVNHHPRPRSSVLVQGTLHDATGKTVRQASSYAGSVFTPEELRFLSLGAIERRLSSPLALDGKPYEVAPGEAMPFMIVLTNVPDQPLEYTAAVVGSDPVNERPVLR